MLIFRKLFKDFCANSTIHGVRYIGERNRNWTERIFWIIAFSSSVLLCNYYILNIWFKWRANPVTVSFTEKEEPISKIPFPMITVCPQSKFYKEKLDFLSSYRIYSVAPELLSHIDTIRLETLLHICINPFIHHVPPSKNKFANNSIYKIIEDVSLALHNTLLYCSWREKMYPCKDLFSTVFTRDGLCFQFNSFNSNEMYTNNIAPEMMTVSNSRSISNWSPEKGYEKGLRSEEYPYRVFNAKQGAALFIVMSLSVEDFNYVCIGPIQGFKVTLTMPGERQKVLSRFFEILNSEKSEILVKPKMVMTSNILRHYSPRQRQCFYQSERQLHFFKIYTQNNCEEECLANFTRNECDCVNFSMPRDKKTKICGVANIDCYKNATKKFFGEDELESDKVKEFRAKCKCLASCQYIKYDADIDRTRFNWTHILRTFDSFKQNYSRFQASLLSVSFADHEVTTLQRSETSTYNDFLATCGGLLGLFLGVSVLSVIEFIYYCTLRLFWTVWREKNNNVVVPFKRETVKSVSISILKPYKPHQYIP